MTMQRFCDRLVAWQKSCGRHGLPWQNSRDPYRVWLSEIMLQQTQVRTVLAYYERFLVGFPDVAALAAAPPARVMEHWSGLGYYSRARNLHQAAQLVMSRWGGHFPPDARGLVQLPGVGPSTANAIAAFCYGERVSILDANVQRVVARHEAFDADLSSTVAVRALWRRADELLPRPEDAARDMPAYTQGLMDLGAGVCTGSRPRCDQCPVAADCMALRSGRVAELPVRSKKQKRQEQTLWWLVAVRRGQVLLQTRPARGIWAQLEVFPGYASQAQLLEAVRQSGQGTDALDWHEPIRHVLTHRELTLMPAVLELPDSTDLAALTASLGGGQWRSLTEIAAGRHGVPAPLRAWSRRHLESHGQE